MGIMGYFLGWCVDEVTTAEPVKIQPDQGFCYPRTPKILEFLATTKVAKISIFVPFCETFWVVV